MVRVKNIKIENFRGIKTELDFPFRKGSNYTSLAIYGKNGTGKSSIVDAWEWLYNYRIEYLAREGAGEKAYPHMDSDGEDCYIEVEFDDEVGTVKFKYNHRRVTQPTITGNYDLLKSKIPHPCHLRYGDLQRFVYYTKAEKYEYLATYLGFSIALTIQNNFKTYSNTLQDKINVDERIIEQNSEGVITIIGEDKDINEENVVEYINGLCAKHNVETMTEFMEAKKVVGAIKKLVDDNPKTKELADWKALKIKMEQFYPISSVKADLERLEELFAEIKEDEANITKLIRVGLYEQGLSALEKSEDKSICPLCDKAFDGDLENHIGVKHEKLKALKAKDVEFETIRKKVYQNLITLSAKIDRINDFESEKVREQVKEFFEKLGNINADIGEPSRTLNKRLLEIDELDLSSQDFVTWIDEIIDKEITTKNTIEENIERLNTDKARKELTDDYTNLDALIKAFYTYELKSRQVKFLTDTKNSYNDIISQYNKWIKEQIQTAFDTISDDLVAYFNILENNHEYIKNPKIKLLTEKDKGIELEIEFAGNALSPAYKVLSESQINSFGLAVFLAAVKHFNSDFKFIILDDVINSFDAFKRPRVIDLISEHFQDYQFLILTHDQIWFDQLIKKFTMWNRLRFFGWDYPTGPKVEVAKNIFERIDEDIEKDRGTEAGQTLGKYLEWILQVFNQNFEAPIHFKIDNQYALIELFDTFKKRAKDKLKETHKLYKKLETFDKDTGFRNYCMHWKDAEYTAEEIKRVFKGWKEIEEMVQCNGKCKRYFQYDRTSKNIKCRCGDLDLKAEDFYELNVSAN